MNRKDFIQKLRRELAKLPAEEREAAIEYYEEYFDEVGPEGEQELLQQLGSPKRVAAQIKSDYAARLLDGEERQPVKKGLSAAWWVVIGICSAPVSIPVAIMLVVLAISIFFVFIAVVISVFAAIAGALAGAVASIIFGVMALPTSFSSALFLIGGGAAALAVMAAAGAGAVIAVRAIVRAAARYARRRSAAGRDKRLIREADKGRWRYRDDSEASWSEGDDEAAQESTHGSAQEPAEEPAHWSSEEPDQEPAGGDAGNKEDNREVE